MKTFKKMNVIKKTDNERKIKQLLSQGYKELKPKKKEAPKKETKKTDKKGK